MPLDTASTGIRPEVLTSSLWVSSMFCSKACLKYDVCYGNPGASPATLATSSFHLLDDDSFSFCLHLHHRLDWWWLAKGDPLMWNTCFPPGSLLSSHLWILYRKLAGYSSWLTGLLEFTPGLGSKLAPYGWPPVWHFASTSSNAPANIWKRPEEA